MMKRIMAGMMAIMALSFTVPASAAYWDELQQDVGTVVAPYEPYVSVVKNTWDSQSLEHIIQGKFDVPDDVINTILSQEISDSDTVKEIHVISHANGRLDIHAETVAYGGIDISGTIDSFIHDGDLSYMIYTVKEKDLAGHGGIKGWIFSHLSVAMLAKLVGPISFNDDVTTKIQGNTIKVDYSQALKKSALAQTAIAGYDLADALQIEGAVPHEGYVEFQTSLQVPVEIQNLLLRILNTTK